MQGQRRFEPLGKARFHVEHESGFEKVVIPAGRNWFALIFLSFWLVGWTAGGIAVMTALVTGDNPDFFLAIWLVGWAVGWVFAASTVGWQLGGKTLLWVEPGALVSHWRMPLLSRTKHYDLGQIRGLRASETGSPFGNFLRLDYPPFMPMQFGTIRFDYGARTVRLAPGLDEAEARLVVAQLAARLPHTAIDRV
jgi:hypothetical protein